MDATTTQLYITLLEKTNQQLSLWSNPYGVLVAVLSFLVAFLAIVAAFILYRQSREYREIYQKALKEYEFTLQENLKNTGIDAETKIQLFIDTKTKEFDALSGDSKKQAKKIIDDLKKEKDSISSRIQFAAIDENQYQPLNLAAHMGAPLRAGIMNIDSYSVIGNSYCSKCGTYNGGVQSIFKVSSHYCSNCGNKL